MSKPSKRFLTLAQQIDALVGAAVDTFTAVELGDLSDHLHYHVQYLVDCSAWDATLAEERAVEL